MDLLALDRDITLAINGWHSPFGDEFFSVLTGTAVWLPMLAMLAVVMYKERGWRETLLIMAGVLVVILLSDQICSLIKHTVCRPRPSHEPGLAGLVHTVHGNLGGMYGYCSAHAANTVGIVVFTALALRHWGYGAMIGSWAVLCMWSRIYLGLHYFGDIVSGALLGAAIATAVYNLCRFVAAKFKSEVGRRLNKRGFIALITCYLAIIIAIGITAGVRI